MNVCTCVYVFVLSDNVISVLLLKRDFALFFGCTECVNNFHSHSYIRNAVESSFMGWGLCISEFPLWLRYGTETNSSPRMWWLGPGNYRWTASSPQTSSKSLYVFVYIFNSLYAVHTYGELKSVVKIMKSFSMPDDFYYCSDQQKASDSWFCTWLYAVIFTCVYLCYTCVISLIYLCILG